MTSRPVSNGLKNRISLGVSRSAEARRCPECGRHGALVEVVEPERRGVVCRWARDSDGRLCSYPGEFFTRHPNARYSSSR